MCVYVCIYYIYIYIYIKARAEVSRNAYSHGLRQGGKLEPCPLNGTANCHTKNL